MSLLRTIGWASAGFAAAHVLESAWHRWIAHGKRPDPTRTQHHEHHRKASEPVDVWSELRDNAGRFGMTLLGINVVLAPLLGLRRTVPLSIGLTAGLVAVNYYHARMHRRAPRGRYEEWMWRFHWHHHAADARVNFGLTNPLLDFALGTVVAPAGVVLHPKLVPAWLREAGGSVAGIHAAG
ncbi:MAG: sterol desaturase family protein [Myxococcota bacterium]|nr:sterol desaturase family protein [Myxococcota bacterium]